MSKPDARLRDQQNGHWRSLDFESATAACKELERWAAEMRAAGANLRDYRAAVVNSCPDEVIAFVSARPRWPEDFGADWFPVRAADADADDLQVWFEGSLGGRTVLLRDLPAEIADRERATVVHVTETWTSKPLSRERRELRKARDAIERLKARVDDTPKDGESGASN